MENLRRQSQAKAPNPSPLRAEVVLRLRWARSLELLAKRMIDFQQVEDLFYNVISRQKAFRSPSEEYAKMLDVVGRYAIHCQGVAFSCKKQGESAPGISTPSNATTVDSIRQIHGGAVANELVNLNVNNAKWGFKTSGWMTNANYHGRRTTLLLFINHRSVESTAVKKALEQVYSAFLPKGSKPFIYLSLEIEPQRVDVNVHPTKREVNFLNEEEIIEEICSELQVKLSSVDTSRTFTTQTLLPGANVPISTLSERNAKYGSSSEPKSTSAKPYENNLVRTDPSLRKITSMLAPSTTTDHLSEIPSSSGAQQQIYTTSPRTRTDCHFRSVKLLRANVRDNLHTGLSNIMSSLTYVGLVDPVRRIAAIQSGVKLYLVDYGLLANELFYQIGLADFQNFGTVRLDPPLDLKPLIQLGVNAEKEAAAAGGSDQTKDRDGEEEPPWHEMSSTMTKHLLSKATMLAEYFNLSIEEQGPLMTNPSMSQGPSAVLSTIPLLLKNYPVGSLILGKLPTFLLRLGPYVNWDDETECFHSFLRELAAFYVPVVLSPPLAATPSSSVPTTDTLTSDAGEPVERQTQMDVQDEETAKQRKNQHTDLEHTLEHVLFPAFRSRLIPTTGLLSGVIEVADLKGLYRVFERC